MKTKTTLLSATLIAIVSAVSITQAAITFDATQDAYLQQTAPGANANTDSLEVKSGGGFTRKTYVEYNLASRSGRLLSSATLDATFFDTAKGSTGGAVNWEFEAYHLANTGDGWDESTITWTNAPDNDTASDTGFLGGATSAGTFSLVGKGVGAQSLTSATLAKSLQSDGNGTATIAYARNTAQFGTNTYVHGFRSSEYATASERPMLSIVEDNVVTNGEFEDAGGVFSTSGWTNSASVATDHAALVSGSNRGAFLDSATNGDLRQTVAFTPTTSDFMFETYFATENGGGSSGDRGFNMFLTNLSGSGQINIRVNGLGQIQVFEGVGGAGGSWQTIIAAGTIAFSEDADENDIFETLNVHRLRIVGHDYGTSGASYDVFLSDANGTDFVVSALGLQFWQNSDPDTLAEGGINAIVFETEFGTGDFAVDAVYLNIIPAPAALPAGLAVILMGAARRRRV